MLLEEVRGGSPVIDLLHPREKPKPHNRRRPLLAAGALAAIVALFAWRHVWNSFATIDAQNQQLVQRLKELDDLYKKASQQQQLADAVAKWNDSNMIWLDELRDLSVRLPSQRDAIVLHLSMKPSRENTGVIDFDGLVRDPSIVARMEHGVRDDYHEVHSKRVQERLREKTYTWHFETSVSVTKRDKEKYVSHLAEPSPAAETAAPASAAATAVERSRPSPE